MDLKVVIEQLAALMYIEKPKKIDTKMPDAPGGIIKFEDLSDSESKPYRDKAKKILLYLDQMNMVIISKKELAEVQAFKSTQLEAVKRIIHDFVEKLNHPKNVALYFPVEELAFKIIEEAGR
jgi:hypothetical protein